MIPAFLTTLLFAVSAVSGRRTSRLLGGTEAHFWRLLFAALLLAAYAHTLGGGWDSVALGVFLISGAVGFGVGDVALFQALPRLGSRLSVIMVMCLSSPAAVLLEWAWMGTQLALGELVCAALILAGVGVALAPDQNPHIPRRKLYVGMSFGLVAAICQALGAVLSRRGFAMAAQAGESISGMTSAYQRILGGVLVSALCLLVVKRESILRLGAGRKLSLQKLRGMKAARRRSWRVAWPWVLLNGLAGPALGVSCYQWALRESPTGIVLPIVALTPLVVMPLARVLEGERPSRWALWGALLAVAGAALLARAHAS